MFQRTSTLTLNITVSKAQYEPDEEMKFPAQSSLWTIPAASLSAPELSGNFEAILTSEHKHEQTRTEISGKEDSGLAVNTRTCEESEE